MAKQYQKLLNVNVLDVLKEKLNENTIRFKADFDLDIGIIQHAASSSRKEDKTLLWMSRPMGTYCHPESEVFVKDSAANSTWLYFAAQEPDSIRACTVELTGVKDGVILGNVYELDFRKLAEEIKSNSVAIAQIEKVFQDGFVDYVDPERSSAGYFYALIEEHGPVVASRSIPADKEALDAVLAKRKRMRSRPSLADKLVDAEAKRRTMESLETGIQPGEPISKGMAVRE